MMHFLSLSQRAFDRRRWHLDFLLVAVLFCTLAGGLRVVDYFAALHAERQENAALETALDHVYAQLARVDADLSQARAIEAELLVLAGIEAPAEDAPEVEKTANTVVTTGDEGDRVSILRTSLEREAAATGDLSSNLAEIKAALDVKSREWAHMPSILPTNGWITAPFGRRKDPFTGRQSFHWGIDVAAGAGTEVVATAAGRVIFSGRNGGYGNQIKIDHGDGIVTTYAHNAKNLVKRGERVERGQLIALVGSTGRSTSSHVHYEVLRDGKKVNPWPFLLPDDSVVD
jgi:murein DD-endopeptidase MepM/ murein hydrolase activator NlpD